MKKQQQMLLLFISFWYNKVDQLVEICSWVGKLFIKTRMISHNNINVKRGLIMKKKIILFVLLIVVLIPMLAGCFPGDGAYTSDKPAGFFWGIWHGWIAPISLIIRLFKEDIRIYEVVNTGWWYDLGFYIAVISGFGGLSLFRKKGKSE